MPTATLNGNTAETTSKSPWKEIILSTGEMVEIRQVNPLLIQKVSAVYTLPDVPTYTVTTVSGAVEVHEMDEQAARETPGGLAQWEKYLRDKNRIEGEQNMAVTNAVLIAGTRYHDLPTDWIELHRNIFGVEVPDNPDAQRGYYLSVVIPPDDVKLLVESIMELSGVSERKVQESEDAFPDPLRHG